MWSLCPTCWTPTECRIYIKSWIRSWKPENHAFPMRFTKRHDFSKSSAPKLFSTIPTNLGTTLATLCSWLNVAVLRGCEWLRIWFALNKYCGRSPYIPIIINFLDNFRWLGPKWSHEISFFIVKSHGITVFYGKIRWKYQNSGSIPWIHHLCIIRPDETTQFSMVQSSSIPRNQSCSMVILSWKSTLNIIIHGTHNAGNPRGLRPIQLLSLAASTTGLKHLWI